MNIRMILCFGIIIVTGCTGQKTVTGSTAIRGRLDLNTVLSWLPADTETLQVANGPFWMSNFIIGQQADENHKVTTEELEKQFQGLTLGSFDSGKGLLEKHLAGLKGLIRA